MPPRSHLLIVSLLMFALAAALLHWSAADAAPAYRVHLAHVDSLPQPQPAGLPPVRIVWIESKYERITPDEAAHYRNQIAAALDYWRVAGVPVSDAAPAEAWHYIADPFADWRWLRPLNNSDWLTIAIVENSAGRGVHLGGGVRAYGYNIPGGQAFFASTWVDHLRYDSQRNAVGLIATHEAGHLFGLPAEADTDPRRDAARHGGRHSPMRDPRWGWEDWRRLQEPHPVDVEEIKRRYGVHD